VENTSTSGLGTTWQADSGQATLDQTKSQMQDMAQQAKETAGNLVGQARTQVKTQLTSQKEKAAESLGGVAEAIRQTGTTLNEQDQPAPVGRYVNQAADVIDNVAQYLRTKDIDEMFGQVEDLARRQPAVFIGAAFALGFMAARFLKSSGTAATSGNGNGRALSGATGYAENRFDAPYYQERETVLEAQLHEQQGYPHKSPYETAREMGIDTSRVSPVTPAPTSNYSSYSAVGDFDRGTSVGGGMEPDLSSDMDDDELTADYTQATSTRSTDV
jgi:hypothetical protein